MQKFYCLYCARNFLNAVSRIAYEIWEPDGRTVRHLIYNERGYSAIEGLAAIMDKAREDGKTFKLLLNSERSENMLYASVVVNGTAVCTVHCYEADQSNNPPYFPQRVR